MSFFEFLQWAFRSIPSSFVSFAVLCVIVQGMVMLVAALRGRL